MSRPKKEGKRATGVQGKKGYLYVVISQPIIKDGQKVFQKKWIKTGLSDSPVNVKKAVEYRNRLLSRKTFYALDLNITICDYIDLFLEKKKREIADTTYSAYYYKSNLIKAYFGNTKVKDLNEIVIEEFLDSLFNINNVQPRTVKDVKVLFGSILEQAYRDGLITYNPVKEVRINKTLADKYAKVKKIDDEFFSYEEAQLFLSRVRDHELYELFYLTIFFGLRREEILGIKWSAININKKILSINHTVTKGTTVNRNNAAKTISSIREYPLTDAQVEMFQNMMAKENYFRSLCGNLYYDSDYIFKHSDGSLYYPDYPTKTFNKIISSIPELPQAITFHGLRSSCVSILVHQGMDVKSIQKWVGHADINTTLKIYAKVKEKEAKQQISDTMTNIIPLKKYNEQ